MWMQSSLRQVCHPKKFNIIALMVVLRCVFKSINGIEQYPTYVRVSLQATRAPSCSRRVSKRSIKLVGTAQLVLALPGTSGTFELKAIQGPVCWSVRRDNQRD